VAGIPKPGRELILQGESCMVGGKGDAHVG
jgi:hypothetical protein